MSVVSVIVLTPDICLRNNKTCNEMFVQMKQYEKLLRQYASDGLCHVLGWPCKAMTINN